MLDLELRHAALLAIARFQRGDHPAGFVAQRAHLVERGMRAGAMKPPSRGEEGRLGDQQKFEPLGEARVAASPASRSARASPASPGDGFSASSKMPSFAASAERRASIPSRKAREIARAAARRPRGAPGRGRYRAHRARSSRRAAPQFASPTKRPPHPGARRSSPTSVKGATSRLPRARAPAAVTVRSMHASRLPARVRRTASRSVRDCAASRASIAHEGALGNARQSACSAGSLPFCVSSR